MTTRVSISPYIWYVVGLLAVVNVFNYMDRVALAVLLPLIKADLDLSDGLLGLLTGLAFALFYAVCGIPVARWADRGVRKDIISLAIATWSVMTALTGAAQNFWHLFLARVGIGVGEAGGISPAQSLICDYVPLERRSAFFALHNAGITVGTMLGMALAGWLGGVIGWRWTFVALGLPGLLLAALVKISLREPARGRLDAAPVSQAKLPLRATLKILWSVRSYRFLMITLIVSGFVQYAFTQWWPSFYARLYGMSPARIGASVGLALGIGSAIGLITGGILADRIGQHDRRIPLRLTAVSAALTLPAALGTLFAPSVQSSILLVGLTGLFWSFGSGPVVAAIYSVTQATMRATGGAVITLFSSILGFGLGPLCVGILSDVLSPTYGAESLKYALLTPVALLPVKVVALYLASNRFSQDVEASSSIPMNHKTSGSEI